MPRVGSHALGMMREPMISPSPARDFTAFAAMFEVKVLECQRKTKHPWEDCIFCHPRENARRRDVTKHRYAAEPCPDYAKDEYCELGDDCPFAHGTFEVHLHPAKYCTKMCTKGAACSRRICFFAHNESELREPDNGYGPHTAAEAAMVKDQMLAERTKQALAEQSGMSAMQHWPTSMSTSRFASLPGFNAPSQSPLPTYMAASALDMPMLSPGQHPAAGRASFVQPLYPAPLDIAAINKEYNAGMDSCNFNTLGDNMADCQSLTSSPMTSLSVFPRPSPSGRSSGSISNAPRMSVRKARELGIEPKKQPKSLLSPGSSKSSSLPHFQTSPVQQSPTKFALHANGSQDSQAKTACVRLKSPEGVKLTIDQAVRMVQFMEGTRTGSLASCADIDFLTAMTRLKLMGWTTCLEEETHSSGNSSPERLSFISQDQTKDDFAQNFPTRKSFDDTLLPGPQCATLLAGSGLDFAPGLHLANRRPWY